MMPDLMRDDIGLRGIARSAEAARKLVEEGGVEIDALIGGAIEGTHRRLRRAAARLVLIGEEVERRLLIDVDELAPHLMRRAADVAGELLGRFFAGNALLLPPAVWARKKS